MFVFLEFRKTGKLFFKLTHRQHVLVPTILIKGSLDLLVQVIVELSSRITVILYVGRVPYFALDHVRAHASVSLQ